MYYYYYNYNSSYLPHTPRPLLPQAIGSWVVSYDPRGVPFWTNSKSKAKTYNLYAQQTDHAVVPIVHAGTGEVVSWDHVLTYRPSPPSPRKDLKSDRREGDDRKWREVYDAVDGTKTWYNPKTRKSTTKDPYW